MTRHRHAPWGWRLLLAFARANIRGLQALGAATTGMPATRFTAGPDAVVAAVFGPTPATKPAAPTDPPTGSLDEPPAGHPERVRPDLAPDDVERRLWAQVRWPAGGSSPRS